MVKNPPAMLDTWVQSLGQKDPMEKGMTTHSTYLPGEPHGQRSYNSVGCNSWGQKESDMIEQLTLCLFTFTDVVTYDEATLD